jgi:phage shock protein PspC (stress-responsive transcriptional regulator)
MRKVTTVNLNGKAYQIEEQGYNALQKYLRHAETALARDPDKAEVLVDIEQAIADKCDPLLKGGKDVVSAEQIKAILDHMGAVESESPKDAKADAANQPAKRLFIVRDGAVLLGVCKGIGAYLDIDANIVRLIFVLLTIFTGGIWIAVYAALGILLPTAKTEAELQEAYGKPTTAQDIITRVKERTSDPETLQRIARVIVRIFLVLFRIISITAAVVFGILTFAWLWVMWQVLFGRLELYGQLQVINGWREVTVVTLAYLLVSLPVFLAFRIFDRCAERRACTRASTISEVALAVLWGLSFTGLVMFATMYAQNARDYVKTHDGQFDFGSSHICVDDTQCGTGDPIYYRY